MTRYVVLSVALCLLAAVFGGVYGLFVVITFVVACVAVLYGFIILHVVRHPPTGGNNR